MSFVIQKPACCCPLECCVRLRGASLFTPRELLRLGPRAHTHRCLINGNAFGKAVFGTIRAATFNSKMKRTIVFLGHDYENSPAFGSRFGSIALPSSLGRGEGLLGEVAAKETPTALCDDDALWARYKRTRDASTAASQRRRNGVASGHYSIPELHTS